MMANEQEDDIADSAPVQKRGLDPVRIALSAAISSLMQSLPDCPARKAAIIELMESEHRIRHAMIRKVVH